MIYHSMGIGLWELCAAKACFLYTYPQIDMWGPVNFPTSGNHDDLLQWEPLSYCGNKCFN